MASAREAQIIGSGLIGGSIGLRLRELGWHVTASEANGDIESQILDLGIADEVGVNKDALVTFVATPVSAIAPVALAALAQSRGIVTDVGSTKLQICSAVSHSRFVGGHPMAGSELDGISGARSDLFVDATWILTPDSVSDDDSISFLIGLINDLGAMTVTLDPAVHDELVAQISHVPHLAAAALMNLASQSAVDNDLLLRLAAGGFRDMTRISAGRTAIWPDICIANSAAIVSGLEALSASIDQFKVMVASKDREGIQSLLESARSARLNLPVSISTPSAVSQLDIGILDRPGELASVTKLAAESGINILDIGISHSAEGIRGVMTILIDSDSVDKMVTSLTRLGYAPRVKQLDKNG